MSKPVLAKMFHVKHFGGTVVRYRVPCTAEVPVFSKYYGKYTHFDTACCLLYQIFNSVLFFVLRKL